MKKSMIVIIIIIMTAKHILIIGKIMKLDLVIARQVIYFYLYF